MKTTIKILILLIAVTLAIGLVMAYAKTKVTPPVAISQINQYKQNVNKLVGEELASETSQDEDDIFIKAIDRIHIFEKEGKMISSEADASLDKFVGSYSPRFLKRCFSTFKQPVWSDEILTYLLSQSSDLKSLLHTDKTPVLHKSTIDSLNLVASIIHDYRDALRISHTSKFTGYDNAITSISKARTYANNPYFANCSCLISDLKSVKSRLAESCYSQVVAKVEELGNYRDYSQNYYDNTLVPQVDRAVTTYDNRAYSVFGSKRDVDALWKKAQNYYNEASNYYE